MAVKQFRSLLFYIMCIFLMQVNASELNNDAIYERMADIMLENKLLRRELEEAVRNMGQHADRITSVEETTKKMEKQVDKIANLEEATKKIEEKADRITNLEETTKKIKKQTDKITNLRKATKKMKRQDDRLTKLEETTNKIEKQAEKIASLEEVTNSMEKQADRITQLEETTNKIEKQAVKIVSLKEATNNIEKQADRITKLEESTNNMEKQVDRITELKETVDKIENKSNGITSVENLVQKLDDQVAKLENSTLKNEKAISDVTFLVTDHDMKAAKVIESSIHAIKDNVMKQSLALRKMVSEEKMVLRGMKNSLDEKFSNFTYEVKYQMSKLNASVESEVSSFKTILKVTEKNLSVTLNDNINYINDTFNQELLPYVTENEQKLKMLHEKMDKESDRDVKALNEANVEIQQLKKRTENIETRQGKRAAFTVRHASTQSNGILKFSTVELNEGSVYDTTTGKFTSPYAGIYGFTASIIEYGIGDNRIYCGISKNGYDYVVMGSRPGEIDGTRVTNGLGTATAAATLHLVKGDSVYVWCDRWTGTALSWSSFTGFLINPDP